MTKPRILFVCTYNGTRARIAEEFSKLYGGDRVEVFSSSFESVTIDDFPIAIMKEVEIDLQPDPPESIFSRARKNEAFDCVITMCATASSELCPVFVSNIEMIYGERAEVIHWSVNKFSCDGTPEENKAFARTVREKIRSDVIGLLEGMGIEISPTR